MPAHCSDMVQETQAHVLQRLVRLAEDIHPVELQRHLLIGVLLFSGMSYKKPFTQDASASQVCACACLCMCANNRPRRGYTT